MTVRVGWALILCAALASACSKRTADTPADTSIFPGGPESSPRLIRVRDGTDDPKDVGDVGEIAVSDSGITALFAEDSVGLVLVIYEADGEVRSVISRRGEGPGEFRLPAFLAFSGDTLMVVSPGRPALLRFSSSGEFIDEVRTSGRFSSGMGVSGDELYFAEYGAGGVIAIAAESVASRSSRSLFTRADPFFARALTADSGARTVRPAFTKGERVFYVGIGTLYEIAAYDLSGEYLGQFARTLPSAKRGPRGLAQIRAALELGATTPGPGGKLVQARLDSVENEIVPFFGRGSFAVDAMDRLWVAGRLGDSTFLDVFSGSTFLGRHVVDCLRSPGGFALNGMYLTLRCGVAPEDELNSLQLYRIAG